jgi:hypothetical protein
LQNGKSSTPEFIIFNSDPNGGRRKGFQSTNKASSPSSQSRNPRSSTERQPSVRSSRVGSQLSGQSSPYSIKPALVQKSPKIKEEFERVVKTKGSTIQAHDQKIMAYDLDRRKSKTIDCRDGDRITGSNSLKNSSNLAPTKASIENLKTEYFSTPGNKGRQSAYTNSHNRALSKSSIAEKEEVQKLDVIPASFQHSASDKFLKKSKTSTYSNDVSPGRSGSFMKKETVGAGEGRVSMYSDDTRLNQLKSELGLQNLDAEIKKLELEVKKENAALQRSSSKKKSVEAKSASGEVLKV